MFGAFKKRLAHVWVWSPLVVVGCSDQDLDSPSVSQIGAISTNADNTKATPESKYATSHDFGLVLTPSTELRHDFHLLNSSKETLVFRQAISEKSCCSYIETLTKSVAPDQEALIPVAFKPNNQPGVQSVRFFLETNDVENPLLVFSVRATVMPEFEVLVLNPVKRLGLGKLGKMELSVSRTQLVSELGTKGVSKLIEAKGKDSAFLRVLNGSKTHEFGKIRKTEQNVEVGLPASLKSGMKLAELLLSWDDNKSLNYQIQWEVVDSIRVAPEGLTLNQSDHPEKHVVLTCDDQPFRITQITGPTDLVGGKTTIPSEPAKNHHLELKIRTDAIAAQEVARIMIHTDHPNQPEVVLAILVLKSNKETTR